MNLTDAYSLRVRHAPAQHSSQLDETLTPCLEHARRVDKQHPRQGRRLDGAMQPEGAGTRPGMGAGATAAGVIATYDAAH